VNIDIVKATVARASCFCLLNVPEVRLCKILKVPLPCSQEDVARPSPEPEESNLHPHILFILELFLLTSNPSQWPGLCRVLSWTAHGFELRPGHKMYASDCLVVCCHV
jgi:hypothetical protein